MDPLLVALQIAGCLALPLLLDAAARRFAAVRMLGPVVLCYVIGIGAAALGAPIDDGIAGGIAGGALVFGLPLLLFGADVRGWITHAPQAALAFGMVTISTALWGVAAGLLFAEVVPDAPAVAGMFVGTYTGGTPNIAAVAGALGVSTDRFVVVNAADLMVGATWLAALMSFAPPLVGRVLRPTAALPAPPPPIGAGEPASRVLGPLLSVVCIGVGFGVARLLPDHADAALLLGLTLAASGLSFVPRVRRLPGARLGRYAMLVFCAAAGTLTDLAGLVDDQLVLMGMAALILYGAVFTHLLLCWLFGIDRDTALITSAAAVMGPALIPPIVEAIGNRDVLLSGLSTAMVGLMVGTWLGVGVAWILG